MSALRGGGGGGRGRDPLVLGINAAYHESAAAVVEGGRLVAAVEEERLSRVKHAKPARIDNPDELPWRAIDAVLRLAGAAPGDLDAVAYGFLPGLRALTLGADPESALDGAAGWGTAAGESAFDARVRAVPAQVASRLGLDVDRVRFVPHHLAHAASAFFASAFEEAAVLVLDGIGEAATGWLGRGRGAAIERLAAVHYPHSLGLLWERVAIWLGLDEYAAQKVMGLAAYGSSERFREPMRRLLAVAADPAAAHPPFEVDAALARLRAPDVSGLERLFGPRRRPDEPIVEPRFAAVARALQEQTERAVLATATRLRALTGPMPALCYSGGVALNCLANAALERAALFPALVMPSAAHDAGTAVGAALAVALEIAPASRAREPATDRADWGTDVGEAEAEAALTGAGLVCERVDDAATSAAAALAEGLVVGFVEGRMELGPRALGHRSVLADPRRADARERLNRVVKKREAYRPFGASILAEALPDWLDAPPGDGARGPRGLMLLAYPVRPERRAAIPAVVHEDGTCRIQAVPPGRGAYRRLLERFRDRTSVPLVLNTSFNDREPIVCTAADAVRTAVGSGMDLLVMPPFAARLR